MSTPYHRRRCRALQQAVKQTMFTDEQPSAIFVDLDVLIETQLALLHSAGFPTNTFHTFAVKANPLKGILEVFRSSGFGAEVASPGELAQALHVGFKPSDIVFDSPAKTTSELKQALQAGVRVNLDNLQELERVAAILDKHPEFLTQQSKPFIGLRINPQIGLGSIAAMSTAGAISKFGIPLLELHDKIVAAFKQHRWLNALHMHVGSQGCPVSMVVDGAQRLWSLLEEVHNELGEARIKAFDIGGGISVDYSKDLDVGSIAAKYQEAAAALREGVPALWAPDCDVQLVTENGRSLVAKTAFVVSRVEYTKQSGGRDVAITHIGADLLLRTALLPHEWPVRLFMFDAAGLPRDGEPVADWRETDVCGPLCFQGDKLAEKRLLPAVRPGDYVMVPDVGAYTLSMYCKYNSRTSPPVYSFTTSTHAPPPTSNGTHTPPKPAPLKAGSLDDEATPFTMKCIRAAETLESVMQFWNQQ